jgi:hypothetical protein
VSQRVFLHSPVLVTLTTRAKNDFQHLVNEKLTQSSPQNWRQYRSSRQVFQRHNTMCRLGRSTGTHRYAHYPRLTYPNRTEKQRLRKAWHRFWTPESKRLLNTATRELKQLLVYKTILERVWAYGIQLWGTASTSSMEILERYRTKAPRMITEVMEAPWYVPNTLILKDLQIPAVKHKISHYSYHYSKRLSLHPNELISNLQEPPETRRLRKNLPIDLPTRFNM